MSWRRPIFRDHSLAGYLGCLLRDAAGALLIALFLAVIARPALGQVGGSIALVSDYRFRGVSLSDEQPALQLNLEYDHDNGWYAGGFASSVQVNEDEPANAQLVAYAGYARRLSSGWGWELGATKSVFLQVAGYDYAELFVGMSADNISARVYFSPDYFGRDGESIYAEFNGAYPLRQHLHVLGHIGFLRPRSRRDDASSLLVDTRLGVGAGIDHWNLQIAWVTSERQHAEYQYQDRHRNTGTLTLSYSF